LIGAVIGDIGGCFEGLLGIGNTFSVTRRGNNVIHLQASESAPLIPVTTMVLPTLRRYAPGFWRKTIEEFSRGAQTGILPSSIWHPSNLIEPMRPQAHEY
jgi:hypothetical protein